MTPLGRFLDGLVSTTIGKAFVVCLGLVSLMVATRHVSPSGLGVYVLMLAIIVFLSEFSSGGTGLAVAQRLARGLSGAEQKNVVGTALNFRLASSLLVGLGAYLAAGPLFRLFGGTQEEIAGALVFLPILVIIESLFKLSVTVLEGRFQFRAIGLTSVLGSVTNLAGIALFVLVLDFGLLGLLVAKVLSRITALGYAASAAHIVPRAHLELVVLKELLAYGFPLQLNFILSFAFTRADTFLISVLLGPAQVAFYEIARRIPDSFSDAYEAFVQVYFPSVAERIEGGERGAASQLIATSVRWIAFGALFVALGATLFGHEIIVLLFTSTYSPSVPAFSLLSVSVAAYLVDSTLGLGLIASGQGGKIPVFNSVRAVASFVLYFVLIERYGLEGAAIGAIVSILLVLPLNFIYLRKGGMTVNPMAAVRPFAVFAFFIVLVQLFGPFGLLAKSSILLGYLVASVAVSVVSMSEVRAALHELARLVGGPKSRSKVSSRSTHS